MKRSLLPAMLLVLAACMAACAGEPTTPFDASGGTYAGYTVR